MRIFDKYQQNFRNIFFVRIEPNSFQDLWDLERIYLSKNGISTILTDTFR